MDGDQENQPVVDNTSAPVRRGRRRAHKKAPAPGAAADLDLDSSALPSQDRERERDQATDEFGEDSVAVDRNIDGDDAGGDGDGDEDGGGGAPVGDGGVGETGRRKRRVKRVRKVRKKKKKKPEDVEDEENAPADGGPLDASDLEPQSPARADADADDDGVDRDDETLDYDRVAAVVIEGADTLPPNMRCMHPVVRVHVVSTEDGKYVQKSDAARPAVHQNEQVTTSAAGHWDARTEPLPFILPLMTRPYQFKGRKSYAPKWRERFLIDQPFNHVVRSNHMLLCELLDFGRAAADPGSLGSTEELEKEVAKDPKTALGWHRLAWCFLKLQGEEGVSHVDKRVRLQLYDYKVKLPPDGMGAPSSTWPPDVWYSYQAWKRGKRTLYPSTLYLTVQGVPKPRSADVIRRPMYPHQRERGPLANRMRDHAGASRRAQESARSGGAGMDDEGFDDGAGREGGDAEAVRRVVTWSRLPGQRSRIPNAIKARVDAGPRGAYTLCWSRSGEYLAIACSSKTPVFPIIIYDIFAEKIVKTLTGHHDLIYEIDWSSDDALLASASSDGTVKVWEPWKTEADEHGRIGPAQVLQHTSFVYCVKFYNWNASASGAGAGVGKTSGLSSTLASTVGMGVGVGTDAKGQGHEQDQVEVVVTGSFDGIIRMWRCDTGEVYLHLSEHKHHVNCIAFDQKGARMFSGDGNGGLVIWTGKLESPKSAAPQPRRKKEDSGDATLPHFEAMRTVADPELHGSPITDLSVVGNRLLIHSRHNMLRTMDLRLFSFIQHYSGLTNYRWGIKSDMSTDGLFVVSGSEDGRVFYWKSETGAQTACVPMGHDNAVTDSCWHPHDDIVAFGAFGDSGPPVLIYYYDRAKRVEQDQLDETRHGGTGAGTGAGAGIFASEAETPRTARSGALDPVETRRIERIRRKKERARDAELRRRMKEVNLDLEPLTIKGLADTDRDAGRLPLHSSRSNRSAARATMAAREEGSGSSKSSISVSAAPEPDRMTITDRQTRVIGVSRSRSRGGDSDTMAGEEKGADGGSESESEADSDLRQVIEEEEKETTILRDRIQSLLSRGSSLSHFVRGGGGGGAGAGGEDRAKTMTGDVLRRLGTPLAQSRLGMGRMGVASAALAVGANDMVDQLIAVGDEEEDERERLRVADAAEAERALVESRASEAAAAADRREQRRKQREERLARARAESDAAGLRLGASAAVAAISASRDTGADANAGAGADAGAGESPLVSAAERRRARRDRLAELETTGEDTAGAVPEREHEDGDEHQPQSQPQPEPEDGRLSPTRPHIPRLPIEPLGSKGTRAGVGVGAAARKSRSRRFRDMASRGGEGGGDAEPEPAGAGEMQIEEFD